MMTLMIACLLIAGFDFHPIWYVVASGVWVGHVAYHRPRKMPWWANVGKGGSKNYARE